MAENKTESTGKELVNADTGEITKTQAKNRTALPESLSAPVVTQMYHDASLLKLEPKEQIALQAPVDREDVEIRPDGLIYLPQVFVRDKLNSIVGIGQWAIVQHSVKMQGVFMYFDGSLFVRGKFVSRAMGEQKYHSNNDMQSYASAYEAAKSDCLVRCCKDMGIAKELWQPKYGREWKKEFAVSVFVKKKDGKTGVVWRRKDVEPFYNETGEVPANQKREALPECPKCKSNKSVIAGKEEYGGGFLCYKKKGGCGHKWQSEQKTENKPAPKTSGSIPNTSRPSPDFSNPLPPESEHGGTTKNLSIAQKIAIGFDEIAKSTPLDAKQYRESRLDLMSQYCHADVKSAKDLPVNNAQKILDLIKVSPERVKTFISQFIESKDNPKGEN